MLKRHLMTHYQPDSRPVSAEVGPLADYPMVAPNYAEQRRTLAKSIGLGTKRKRAQKEEGHCLTQARGAKQIAQRCFVPRFAWQ